METSIPQPEAEERAKHILVVEDDITLRYVIAEWLRHQKYIVFEAASADQAIAILDSPLPVDMVISDIEMPGSCSGYDLAFYLRKHKPGLPVIMVSGNVPRKTVQAMGISEFFQKPYDFHAIAARIETVFSKNKA